MKNLGSAFFEALIVLMITQIPLFLGLVVHVMGKADATFTVSTAMELFGGTFSPGDVLSYAAGILGSSLAYAVMKIGYFRVKPALTLTLIVAPIVVFFLAAPVYIQDLDGQVENREFANHYVLALLFVSFVLWIHALYQSRAFFEISLPGSGDSDKIVSDIEGT